MNSNVHSSTKTNAWRKVRRCDFNAEKIKIGFKTLPVASDAFSQKKSLNPINEMTEIVEVNIDDLSNDKEQ